MKITFICGSLAPGEDGVGDYTRALAGELQRQGHACQLISINERPDMEHESHEGIEILRLVNARSADKEALITQAIDRWQPDWISLQFVCFAFHPKGFIHQWTPLIRKLRTNRKLEIMFHELWVGEQPSLPFKHKVMGRIQQWQILRALKQWQPDQLDTSNRLYQHILQRHGYRSNRLPIFGNIQIQPKPAVPVATPAPKERILLFPFSQRHDWNVDQTLEQLKQLSQAAGLSLRLVQIGGLRSGLQHWERIQDFARAQGWPCLLLGRQPAEIISQWMHAADIGISSAHIELADKSGAAIAMHEHGLPVICTITDPISNRFKEPAEPCDGLYSFYDSPATLLALFRNPIKRPPQSRLPLLADQWIQHLAD